MDTRKSTLCMSLILLLAIPLTSSQCLTEKDDNNMAKVDTDLKSITDFNLDLFREIFPYNSTRNFFFSPYSIWNALTLAYFGAEGHTLLQLQKVLGLTDKVSSMKKWKQLQYMYEQRQTNNSDYIFNLANRAYFDNSVNVRQCLADIMTDEIKTLDFKKPGKAAKEINDFVFNTTKGRIPDIVSPSDISNSKMALVNAAFFKGTWLYQFKRSATTKQIFYSSPDDLHFVNMMTQKGNFKSGISEALGAHVLELPYTGKDISMIILLPPFIAGVEGFNNMVSSLTGSLLHEAIENVWPGQIEISIPKFKLEENIGDELMIALSNMGITDLFSPKLSNLTSFDPAGGLSVSKSIHKAFLEISEEGTEAAAATALIQFRIARPLEPEKFVCNHPFLFVIFDNASKNILFLGAYKNPRA